MKKLSELSAVFVLLMLAMLPAFALPVRAPAQAFGQRLRWRQGTVQIAISSSLTRQNANIKYDSDVAGAVRRSLQTWQRYLDFQLVSAASDKQSISAAGVRGDGISLITVAPSTESALLFSQDLQESAAATRVFYDKRGFITEADIALNPYQQFSTDGTFGTFDLESTLTHEIGHLLGLEHSDVLGATMHEKYGKNGAYGLNSFSARTLSLDDISAIQDLYGPTEDSACCQRIDGKLTSSDLKPVNWQVWAEDAQTGQVRAVASSDAEGNFSFSGLNKGSVLLFAQDRAGETFSSGKLGTVSPSASDSASIVKTVSVAKPSFKLRYLGFNAQLSDVALALNSGKVYTLYLGGTDLNPSHVTVGFTSPYLSVVSKSVKTIEFGSDMSVISFDVKVDPRTPAGDYTVFVSGSDGMKRFIVGGVTVEQFPNLLAVSNLTAD